MFANSLQTGRKKGKKIERLILQSRWCKYKTKGQSKKESMQVQKNDLTSVCVCTRIIVAQPLSLAGFYLFWYIIQARRRWFCVHKACKGIIIMIVKKEPGTTHIFKSRAFLRFFFCQNCTFCSIVVQDYIFFSSLPRDFLISLQVGLFVYCLFWKYGKEINEQTRKSC